MYREKMITKLVFLVFLVLVLVARGVYGLATAEPIIADSLPPITTPLVDTSLESAVEYSGAYVVDCSMAYSNCKIWFGTYMQPIDSALCTGEHAEYSVFYDFPEGGLTYLPTWRDASHPIHVDIVELNDGWRYRNVVTHLKRIGEGEMASLVQGNINKNTLIGIVDISPGLKAYGIPTTEEELLEDQNYQNFALNCFQ